MTISESFLRNSEISVPSSTSTLVRECRDNSDESRATTEEMEETAKSREFTEEKDGKMGTREEIIATMIVIAADLILDRGGTKELWCAVFVKSEATQRSIVSSGSNDNRLGLSMNQWRSKLQEKGAF